MSAPTVQAPTGQSMRYELKFVVSPIDLARIELGVRLHRGAFRSAHPDRQVNNIYFDSSELEAYAQNLAGVGVKLVAVRALIERACSVLATLVNVAVPSAGRPPRLVRTSIGESANHVA